MSEAPALFSDGKAYERMMGRWSQMAGKLFLDWLAVPKGLNWLDVGCIGSNGRPSPKTSHI